MRALCVLLLLASSPVLAQKTVATEWIARGLEALRRLPALRAEVARLKDRGDQRAAAIATWRLQIEIAYALHADPGAQKEPPQSSGPRGGMGFHLFLFDEKDRALNVKYTYATGGPRPDAVSVDELPAGWTVGTMRGEAGLSVTPTPALGSIVFDLDDPLDARLVEFPATKAKPGPAEK